jgi:hypothetical protein
VSVDFDEKGQASQTTVMLDRFVPVINAIEFTPTTGWVGSSPSHSFSLTTAGLGQRTATPWGHFPREGRPRSFT